MNSREAERAMPLEDFIAETMAELGSDADEILVERARGLRANAGPNEHAVVDAFNQETFDRFGPLLGLTRLVKSTQRRKEQSIAAA